MEKLRVIVFLFLFVFSPDKVFAESAFTSCPATITCNYDQGICDNPSNTLLIPLLAQEPFLNSQSIRLSLITAGKIDNNPNNSAYRIHCVYKYGEHSSFSIGYNVKKLTGLNWVFSGFDKTIVTCKNLNDPINCSHEI
jgi:hypothetical protein